MPVANGILTNVHADGDCLGEHCWIHKPSVHHMVGWPVAWHPSLSVALRLCEHNEPHPDPDDVAYNATLGRRTDLHDCDGCCLRDES